MSLKQKNIVITAALRTAIGSFRGSLKDFQAHELGSIVVKEVMKKAKLSFKEKRKLKREKKKK